MTEYESGQPSTWALSGITFAATIMLLIGIFQALEGLSAILDDDFFVKTANYTYNIDTTGWGWIHLILGIVVAFAGWALFSRRAWAGVFAIFLAMLSALSNFFFIPYYPLWSLLIIALNVWVIWALTRPGSIRTE